MPLQPKTTTFEAPKNILASEHFVVLPQGITIDHDTVPSGDDGTYTLLAGTRMGKITSGGKYGPYDSTAKDGREVGKGLLMYDVRVQDPLTLVLADGFGSLLIHGFVKTEVLPTVLANQIHATFAAFVPAIVFV